MRPGISLCDPGQRYITYALFLNGESFLGGADEQNLSPSARVLEHIITAHRLMPWNVK
jgi:hypothetical protein